MYSIVSLEDVLSPAVGTTAMLFAGQAEHCELPFEDENVPLPHG